jgi:hypothetical protein
VTIPGCRKLSNRPRRLAGFRKIANGRSGSFLEHDYFVFLICRAILLLSCVDEKKVEILSKTAR